MVKKAKIILLGETSVGKSCIISAFNGDQINANHEPTIGMDFSIKHLNSGSNEYKLQIWDTAGQQKFRSIMPTYIRNSKLALIVYDITCIKSFDNVEKWMQIYREFSANPNSIILVGNKLDLKKQCESGLDDSMMLVSQSQVLQKASKMGATCINVSAKEKTGIDQLLQQIGNHLDCIQLQDSQNSTSNGVQKSSFILSSQILSQNCCKQ